MINAVLRSCFSMLVACSIKNQGKTVIYAFYLHTQYCEIIPYVVAM
jgi:hypothetical protein